MNWQQAVLAQLAKPGRRIMPWRDMLWREQAQPGRRIQVGLCRVQSDFVALAILRQDATGIINRRGQFRIYEAGRLFVGETVWRAINIDAIQNVQPVFRQTVSSFRRFLAETAPDRQADDIMSVLGLLL